MRRIFVGAGWFVVAATGCDREPPDRLLDTPGSARQIFEKDVEPLLETTCVDCHSNPGDAFDAPDFLDVFPGDHYESLVSRRDFVSCAVDDSWLLAKGLEPEHPGGHLTEPQHRRVEGWLVAEANERFGGVCQSPLPSQGDAGADPTAATPTSLSGLEALAQFGDCMTLDDWLSTGMPSVALQTASSQQAQVPCYSCHSNGEASNWMVNPAGSGAEAAVPGAFEEMRKVKPLYKLVRWTVNKEDASFKDIVPSHRWRDKGTEPGGHPQYQLDQKYQEAVDAWFDLVYSKWKSGSCAP